MPVLIDFTQAIIDTNVNTIYGKILTVPTLYAGDPSNLTYVCDVDIGVIDPTGLNQGTELMAQSALGSTLRNVPVASNNGELLYADVGAAVTLTRSSPTTAWKITGFSTQQPGTYNMYPVDLGTMTLGPVQNLSISGRLLTLGELATLGGGFGTCPFGASGIFVGGVFQYVGGTH